MIVHPNGTPLPPTGKYGITEQPKGEDAIKLLIHVGEVNRVKGLNQKTCRAILVMARGPGHRS